MAEELPLVDFGDPAQKRRIIRHLETIVDGVHRVKVKRVRDQITTKQRGYYFAVICPHAAKGIRDQWGEEFVNSMDAHEFFKDRFLRIPVVDHITGELMGYRTRSTTELDKAEFSRYVEACIQFCFEYLHVAVPTPFNPKELPADPAAPELPAKDEPEQLPPAPPARRRGGRKERK